MLSRSSFSRHSPFVPSACSKQSALDTNPNIISFIFVPRVFSPSLPAGSGHDDQLVNCIYDQALVMLKDLNARICFAIRPKALA